MDTMLEASAEKVLLMKEPVVDFAVQLKAHIPDIVAGVVVFFVIYLLTLFVRATVKKACRLRELDEDIISFLGRVVSVGGMILAIVSCLGTMGVNVSALVAGLGLTGFALGFALKDLLSNLLSGVMILLYRPFKRGDHISAAGYEGTVTEIDLRYTTLQGDEETYLVPNSLLFSKGITLRKKNDT